MKTSLKTRAVALVASILVTTTTVHLIASYAFAPSTSSPLLSCAKVNGSPRLPEGTSTTPPNGCPASGPCLPCWQGRPLAPVCRAA
ncbi:MAG TPA: hypothetical protein VLE94_05500 [Burkholderiaceae bacterium]|nr:hypothetical protein [Burkholderiaceae bacterium]